HACLARGVAWPFTAIERESQTAASRLCTRPAEELTAQADLAQAAQRRRARIGPDRLPRVARRQPVAGDRDIHQRADAADIDDGPGVGDKIAIAAECDHAAP